MNIDNISIFATLSDDLLNEIFSFLDFEYYSLFKFDFRNIKKFKDYCNYGKTISAHTLRIRLHETVSNIERLMDDFMDIFDRPLVRNNWKNVQFEHEGILYPIAELQILNEVASKRGFSIHQYVLLKNMLRFGDFNIDFIVFLRERIDRIDQQVMKLKLIRGIMSKLMYKNRCHCVFPMCGTNMR